MSGITLLHSTLTPLQTTGALLCVVVVSTVISGLLIDQSVVYFPCDISRTATGPVARVVFPLGVAGVCIYAGLHLDCGRSLTLALFGLFILALFDDDRSPAGHTVGIILMAAGVGLRVYWEHSPGRRHRHLVLLGAALMLYLFRILLKVFATLERPYSPHTWVRLLCDPAYLKGMVRRVRGIMQGTVKAGETTLAVYRATGVMQWLVFYMVAQVVLGVE